MNGAVVHGHRGERQGYRPVVSHLLDGADPLDVATALLSVTGTKRLYVADLDAISRRGDHCAVLQRLRDSLSADLLVDAGSGQTEAARQVLDSGATCVVVGTETLPDVASLQHIRERLGHERVLLSVDTTTHGVLSRCDALRGRSPLDVLRLLDAASLGQALVLHLDRVGTGTGPARDDLRAVRSAYPQLRLVAGGGVRTPAHLAELAAAGVDAVLVATALHEGWITRGDIERTARGTPEFTNAS